MAKPKAPARKSPSSTGRTRGSRRPHKKTAGPSRAKSARSTQARKKAAPKKKPTATGRAAAGPRPSGAERPAPKRRRATGARAGAAGPAAQPLDARRRKPPDVPRAARPASVAEAEIEETLVETPTSFSLDLRRARDPRTTIEEPSDVDPNSPLTLAAGDYDVRWEAAAVVGDEAPGGDNPTPDMDVVDLIGRSLGVEYEDNEELRGAEKIAERDRHRWELDPKSAESYRTRTRS